MITFNKTKFCCLSDLHLVNKNPICRKDDLTQTQWDKIKQVYYFAANNNADVIIAGDLHAVSNDYAVLSKFSKLLCEAKTKGVETWIVFGQHDLKNRNPENTNTEILINSGLLNLIPRSGMRNLNERSIAIYGCSWMDDIPEPGITTINILVIHAPISPKSLFPGGNYIRPSTFMYEHPFDIVICGDIHRTFEAPSEYNAGVCLNSGPLLRREADEYSFIHKPGFWFLDIDKIKWEYKEIEYQLSENVLTREHINKQKKKEQEFNEANASKFLSELKSRTAKEGIIKIEDRLKEIIYDDNSSIKPGTKTIIEILMNNKDLESWLQKQEKQQKQISRMKPNQKE